MRIKNNIERAVCEYFKVDVNDIYTSQSSKYPLGIAKEVLMYLLYSNGYKSYQIAKWFDITPRMIYQHCGFIQVELKSDTKIKEDIEKINQQINI